jgi:signal transduction histidine kinase
MDKLSQMNINITEEILDKWQNIVDIMAKIMNVPTALIMEVDYPHIEVFKASSNPENPYGPGDQEHLAGLYCETVIKTQSKLLVPNALKDPEWKDNPDVKLGMISYLGLPLNWPNGVPFGTICILDNKENSYNEDIKMLLKEFRDMAEMHLTLLFQNNQLQESRGDFKRAFNQTEFLKDILIHDINNIFQGLKLNISIFSKKIKDELFGDQKEILLHNLEEQIKKGTRLVSNVRTYSKVEAGRKGLEAIDLITYLNKSIESLNKNFPKKDIQLKKNITIESGAARILANKFLEDLFDNLLTNAVKHNESEIIKISVNASEIHHKNENWYRVEFCDNGVGIPDERKSTLIREKHFDTHNGIIRFGLSIIKKLINKYNGKLLIQNRIEDDYTQGTCFILLFPILI